MKRFIIAILALVFLALPPLAPAASVVNFAYAPLTPASVWKVVTITWTAHTDGTVTSKAFSTAFTQDIPANIQYAATDPGSTAPTDNYDITITDALGNDVFGGELTNRDTTTSESAEPAIPYIRVNLKDLNFNLSGNSQNGATGTVKIYVYVKRD